MSGIWCRMKHVILNISNIRPCHHDLCGWDPVTSNLREKARSYWGDCSDSVFFFLWREQQRWSCIILLQMTFLEQPPSGLRWFDCNILKHVKNKQKHVENSLWYIYISVEISVICVMVVLVFQPKRSWTCNSLKTFPPGFFDSK